MKRHIRATDVLALGSLDEVLPIVSFELERTIIEMNIAIIDTTVIINAETPLQFLLKTYLVFVVFQIPCFAIYPNIRIIRPENCLKTGFGL